MQLPAPWDHHWALPASLSLWLHLAGAWHHQTRFFLAREVGFTHSAVTLGSIFSYIINGPIAAGFLLMDGTRGGVLPAM